MPKRARTLTLAWMLALGCGGPTGPDSQNGLRTRDGGTNLKGHLDSNPGQTGATCETACDCQAGLSCKNGKCTTGASAMYCCSAASCPQGQSCQAESGQVSVCGGGSTPPAVTPDAGTLPPLPDAGGLPGLPDGGASGFCGLLTCLIDADCMGTPFGCSTCDPVLGTCR